MQNLYTPGVEDEAKNTLAYLSEIENDNQQYCWK